MKNARRDVDPFGNPIDPAVRYARGSILGSSTDEFRKLAHAHVVIRKRVAQSGEDSIYILTGNQRNYPIQAEDIGTRTEEWVGSALLHPRLKELVREHLGAPSDAEVAVFNRSSAGIIATISALAQEESTVVSVAPLGSGAHASVKRGCYLARARVREVGTLIELQEVLEREHSPLVVITPVCSELNMLGTRDFEGTVEIARRHGAVTFVDDAYGARIRPVLYGGPRSLELGADLAISNSDKAGLEGPRGGYMAGRPDLVTRVQARAGEFGLEARTPITLGIVRCLERWDPENLQGEARAGAQLFAAMEESLGAGRVVRTSLGPMITEDEILALALQRAGLAYNQVRAVPAEASAALGMVLLERFGLLTVNVAGAPGARVSVRLKPTMNAVDRFGGAKKMAAAVDNGISLVAELLGDSDKMSHVILGTQ